MLARVILILICRVFSLTAVFEIVDKTVIICNMDVLTSCDEIVV